MRDLPTEHAAHRRAALERAMSEAREVRREKADPGWWRFSAVPDDWFPRTPGVEFVALTECDLLVFPGGRVVTVLDWTGDGGSW